MQRTNLLDKNDFSSFNGDRFGWVSIEIEYCRPHAHYYTLRICVGCFGAQEFTLVFNSHFTNKIKIIINFIHNEFFVSVLDVISCSVCYNTLNGICMDFGSHIEFSMKLRFVETTLKSIPIDRLSKRKLRASSMKINKRINWTNPLFDRIRMCVRNLIKSQRVMPHARQHIEWLAAMKKPVGSSQVENS